MAKSIFIEAQGQADQWSGKVEVERYKRLLTSMKNQAEAIAERVGLLPKGLDPSTLFVQMAKLQAAQEEAQQKLNEAIACASEKPNPASLKDFENFTQHLRELLKS